MGSGCSEALALNLNRLAGAGAINTSQQFPKHPLLYGFSSQLKPPSRVTPWHLNFSKRGSEM